MAKTKACLSYHTTDGKLNSIKIKSFSLAQKHQAVDTFYRLAQKRQTVDIFSD